MKKDTKERVAYVLKEQMDYLKKERTQLQSRLRVLCVDLSLSKKKTNSANRLYSQLFNKKKLTVEEKYGSVKTSMEKELRELSRDRRQKLREMKEGQGKVDRLSRKIKELNGLVNEVIPYKKQASK